MKSKNLHTVIGRTEAIYKHLSSNEFKYGILPQVLHKNIN